jgi:hypothetical protein
MMARVIGGEKINTDHLHYFDDRAVRDRQGRSGNYPNSTPGSVPIWNKETLRFTPPSATSRSWLI